jgi:hypothetical protein
MAHRMQQQPAAALLTAAVALAGMLFPLATAHAKASQPSSGKSVSGSACDYRAHPSIATVTPSHVKPGQKITIRGKNFGSRQCFHSVSFGRKSTEAWTYVSSSTVEATVPDLRPGAVPVTVSTEAGTSQYTVHVASK